MATKREKQAQRQKLHEARKSHTRAKALRELNNGADFNDKKYTNHPNYHVRMRAWVLGGRVVPETTEERKQLCDSLSKGRTAAGVLATEVMLGLGEAVAEGSPFVTKAA